MRKKCLVSVSAKQMQSSALVTEHNIGSEIMSVEELEGNSMDCGQEVKECGESRLMTFRTALESAVGISRPAKRNWSEDITQKDEQSGDDFTVVQRKAKRHLRRDDKNIGKEPVEIFIYEVSLTSTEVLPKQIGLVKLLKAENLVAITSIKYKSPYKVFIRFETKEEAEKLLNSAKVMELGYKCHLTNEVNYSYGTVRYIEMDVEEKELLESFTCETEIVSVRRLRKLTDEGKWIQSETVRFCFKGCNLPAYIYGYGGRFRVEPYIFPVTQCGNCWIFGHLTRNCPKKERVCPKCTKKHENCDIESYRCVNCKGDHMANNKKCPVFLKEKRVRELMSRDNCTYKMALSAYLKDKKDYRRKNFSASENEPTTVPSQGKKLFEDEIIYTIHQKEEMSDDSEEDRSGPDEPVLYSDIVRKSKNKKNKKKSRKAVHLQSDIEETDLTEKSCEERTTSKERKNKKRSFMDLLWKTKDILLSEKSMDEKIISVVKILFEWVTSFIGKVMSNGETISKFINGLFNG